MIALHEVFPLAAWVNRLDGIDGMVGFRIEGIDGIGIEGIEGIDDTSKAWPLNPMANKDKADHSPSGCSDCGLLSGTDTPQSLAGRCQSGQSAAERLAVPSVVFSAGWLC